MIRVVAVLTAKPGRRGDLLALFRANMPAVHAEDGCVEYQPFVDAEGFGAFQTPVGPDSFVVLETWASADALKAHAAAPHMVTYGKASRELIADRKIHIFSPA
ncbi:MAG: antibiotic biosynthesis monooxygenase [Pseudomonadota bacterium]|nr:antibiotic biosynthesis monooxygenase [Pseudomonadota bacterium]